MQCGLALIVFVVSIITCRATKRYELHTECKTWEGAVIACLENGGRLASILDSVTHAKLRSLIIAEGHHDVDFWFDARDVAKEGHWTSYDGTPISYQNWAEGEPNDHGVGRCGGNQDCAKLWSEKDDFLWDDESCCQENGYICEYTGDTADTTATPSVMTSSVVSTAMSLVDIIAVSKIQTSAPTLDGSQSTGKPEAENTGKPEAEKYAQPEESCLKISFIERAVVMLLVLSVINFIVLVGVVVVVYQFVWKKIHRRINDKHRYQDLINHQTSAEDTLDIKYHHG
ncbi:uncharacterized protein [Ptychodera flava]|uniref:uncharacterized protein n=1 Tax=Ptychodera flava TaxID=63121 RepID=UPI00396A200C